MKTLVLTFLLAFVACTSEHIPAGRILIRNDILDREYNAITVDQVLTASGLLGFRKILKPGEHIILPKESVRSVRFTRAYKDFARVYVITCPELSNKGILIKLIDVHTGRLPGGCALEKKGIRRRDGIIQWGAEA